MTWFLNFLISLGLLALTVSALSAALAWVWPGWRRTLVRVAKSGVIIGILLVAVPSVAKLVGHFLFQPPSAEEVAQRQQAKADAAAQKAMEKAREDQEEVEQAMREAREDADRAQQAASNKMWIVPSGQAGYFISDGGIVDRNTVYLSGGHPVRPGGKVVLVDTGLEEFQFFDTSGDYATIDATSADNKNTTIALSVTWAIVPENLPKLKSRMGPDFRYTPVIINLTRGVVRNVIATKKWENGAQDITDRTQLTQDIQTALETATATHFQKLGMGDVSPNLIRYGLVSVRNVTHAN